MVIQINNKRIIDFCTKHPTFDIEKTMLSFIDFVENTYSSANPCLDSNLASQILTNLKSIQQQVQSMDSTISIKQNDIKKEYIDDLKNILMLNNNEKIVPIIKEYNQTFTNKIALLFKDIIPKEQQAQTQYLQTVLKGIEQNVAIEINKGVNCALFIISAIFNLYLWESRLAFP